jgi:DNA-binding TFAR19-related protein (PDSD5 family)
LSDDKELEILRRKRLLEMKRRLVKQQEPETVEVKEKSPSEILNGVFYNRAWEVWSSAERQFPTAIKKVEAVLVEIITSGKFKGRINGEELLWFLRRVGLDVRMKTKIRIYERGELKTIADKLKDE